MTPSEKKKGAERSEKSSRGRAGAERLILTVCALIFFVAFGAFIKSSVEGGTADYSEMGGTASERILETASLQRELFVSPNYDGNGNAVSDCAVNINTADAEELQTLDGIGQKKAEAIIRYREEHGGFKTVDELCKVSGIGKRTLEALRGKITVE